MSVLLFVCVTAISGQERYEAESAKYSNCQVVADKNYSGGKALRMTEGNARVEFEINASHRGKYKIYAGGNGIGGDKVVRCTVNGSSSTFHLNTYGEVEIGSFIMKQGANSVVISPDWTWFDIDYIRVQQIESELAFNISPSPVDENATEAARAMYSFLLNNFGKKTVSGMMLGDMSSANGNVLQHDDIKAIYSASGYYPALVGFDFMNTTGLKENDSWYRSYSRATITLAKDIYKRGGFPAFTWHWRDPSRSTEAFYTSDTQMKITKAMNADGSWNTSSTLYKNIIKDIDVIADCMLELQNAGVACIFRPLHEANGGWFWWGREGSEAFCKLYRLVFDEMVKVKGVHNVIWVWNADASDASWNPGKEYFDVVSADIYNDTYDYSSNYVSFDNLKSLTNGEKLIALSENGPIPDIEKEVEDEAVWSWWMPWYNTWDGNFVKKTSTAEWKKCMGDERVITLEDMSGGWSNSLSVPQLYTGGSQQHRYFDMSGRRITSRPSHGLYIKDNKKVVVR